MKPLDLLLSRLDEKGLKCRPSGNGYEAQCPRHGDTNPSLSIAHANGKLLLCCHAGCETKEIVAALGLEMRDLCKPNGKAVPPLGQPVATYPYVDENSRKLFEVCRFKPKTFRQRKPDGNGGYVWKLGNTRRVLYRLNMLPTAIKSRQVVWVVEGEDDVHTLEKLGFTATTNPGGAEKWKQEYSESLRGANVVIIPDNDRTGHEHAQQVAASLQGIAAKVKVVELLNLPDKGDVQDWLANGGNRDELLRLASEAPEWQASENDVPTQHSLPTIVAKARPLRDVVADGVEAIREANDPPVLFVRNGQLTGVDFNETGRPVLKRWTTARVRFHASKAAEWIVQLKDGDKHISPPRDVIESIMVLGEWPLPALIGITESPVLRADGGILDSPGYDESTKLFYAPSSALEFPPLPEEPTETDLANALLMLNDVFQDFPFVDHASHANALGALLTLALRHLIEGPVPLFLFDKPKPGTGSSLLVDVNAKIATGRAPTLMTAPDNDEEMRKKITAVLDEGASLPVFDNVSDSMSSDSLSAAITAEDWADRRLGRNELVRFTTRNTTWFMTGNNLRLRGDLARRSVWIRIDAKTSRP